MKKCPFCVEEIQEEAVKCRHCDEFLDQKSLQELLLSKKVDRQLFNAEEAADYLRVQRKTIDTWVKSNKIPFSKLPNKQIAFRKKDIDKWIGDNKVTEYHRFVSERKTLDDVLPPNYKPLTEDEELGEIIGELHEKYIARHCREDGFNEAEYARMLKGQFIKESILLPDKSHVKRQWDFKKRKYVVTSNQEGYDNYLKKDENWKNADFELTLLMQYLTACY
jgi:excisionase family DNA binding protein